MSQERTFFAVSSLGNNRWYWVVWPSLQQLQQNETTPQLADGICPTKVAAVDAALEVAGMHGEWLPAKYAKAHYDQQKTAHTHPAQQEFLYNDQLSSDTNTWRSVPYRVVKQTKQYVYIEQQPYVAAQRTGTWLDHNAKTLRLDRSLLETEGYTFLPMMAEFPGEITDPLFFRVPLQERVGIDERFVGDALSLLGLRPPCTVAAVKTAYRRLAKQLHPDVGGDPTAFLKLQEAYRHALQLCP